MIGDTFQIYNKEGIEVLNDKDPMMLVVYSGTQDTLSIPKVWAAWPEPPTVFIRPKPDVWCGAFNMFRRANDNIQVYCGGEFDYVICCSPTSWFPGGVRTFGLETFNEDGSLLFSTNSRFARITTITRIPGPDTSGQPGVGQPITSAALTGWTSMPWFNVGQAAYTAQLAQEDYSWQLAYLVTINAALTQMRMTISDNIGRNLNPLYGRYAYFPMGFIEGN